MHKHTDTHTHTHREREREKEKERAESRESKELRGKNRQRNYTDTHAAGDQPLKPAQERPEWFGT